MTEPKPMDSERLAELRDSEDGAAIITPDRVAELLADRDCHVRRADAAEARAAENRGLYADAHSLLCDLNRRLNRAFLPAARTPTWDETIAAAERFAEHAERQRSVLAAIIERIAGGHEADPVGYAGVMVEALRLEGDAEGEEEKEHE